MHGVDTHAAALHMSASGMDLEQLVSKWLVYQRNRKEEDLQTIINNSIGHFALSSLYSSYVCIDFCWLYHIINLLVLPLFASS